MNKLYYKFSEFLINKYGEKVYKIPLNIKTTCPNRDGKKGYGGCIFCGDEGAGFELKSNEIDIIEQLKSNINYIGKKYNANKYIAYFQNYTNTYLEFNYFCNMIESVCIEGIVAIYISTRPDCIFEEQLEFLNKIKNKYNIDIVIEIGLQSINNNTLQWLNRMHTYEDFLESVVKIKKYDIEICVHLILDIPIDSIEDIRTTANILSNLKIEQIKCHSLFVVKNTKLASMYEKNEFVPISLMEFIERSIAFIENLDKNIVIQRLIGRAPKENTIFCNHNTSWWKIRDMIEEKMQISKTFQGNKFNKVF